jgi:hypothetical protein
VEANTNIVFKGSNSAPSKSCGLLSRNGIYYALLKMRGQAVPLEIALHGIRYESEAQTALAALSMLRDAECPVARP